MASWTSHRDCFACLAAWLAKTVLGLFTEELVMNFAVNPEIIENNLMPGSRRELTKIPLFPNPRIPRFPVSPFHHGIRIGVRVLLAEEL
jgi:hypothetical protein